MSGDALWKLAGTVVTLGLLALLPWLLMGVQGEAALPADWLARVQGGEWLHLTDVGRGLHIGVEGESLRFREAPRWFPVVLMLPAELVLGGLTAGLWWAAGDHDGWTWAGLIAGGFTCLGLGLWLGGLVTHDVVRGVEGDRLHTTHSAFFGAVCWEEDHRLTGPAQWRVFEDCSPVDGEEVCLGWVHVDVPTDRGFVRLARLPHSMGTDADYDVAQEDAASSLVVGIRAFRSAEEAE